MSYITLLNSLLFGHGHQAKINETYTTGGGSPSAPFVPFPTYEAMAAGAIRQTHLVSSSAETLLKSMYDTWVTNRLVTASFVTAGGYAVRFNDPTYLYVSEGMGYGMLILVLMAGYDANAQTYFDGLLKTARAKPALGNMSQGFANAVYLMDWKPLAGGTSWDPFSALDGDMDMALALIMAHRQWGSNGTYNYLQEARNTLLGIKDVHMATDGRTKSLANSSCSRTSDWMPNHWVTYGLVTGDSFWTNTCSAKAVALTRHMISAHSPVARILPDFIVSAETTTPIPSPGGFGNGDGNLDADKYFFNACRNPWRQGTQFIMTGDSTWRSICADNVNFFYNKYTAAGGGVVGVMTAIDTGYSLSGATMQTFSGQDTPSFIAPVMVGCMINSTYQNFLNDCWAWNSAHVQTQFYFDGEIQMICMLVANGNWWDVTSI